MKKLLMVLLALMVLSGCDLIEENKSLKVKNQELEQKVKELEQRVIQLEQVFSKVKQDDFQLDACLAAAKERRENNIRLNDTGYKKEKGAYSVPSHILQNIQNVYKDDCEECFRRYGRR